jgi:hypothetical protein
MDDLIPALVTLARRLTAANIVDGLALYNAAFDLVREGNTREIHHAGFTHRDSVNLANRLATLHSQSPGGFRGNESQWKSALANLLRLVQNLTADLQKLV